MSFVQQRTNKNKKDSSEREDIDSSDDKLHSIIECRKNQPSIISNPYKKKSSNKKVVIDYSSLVTPARRIHQEVIDLAVVAANENRKKKENRLAKKTTKVTYNFEKVNHLRVLRTSKHIIDQQKKAYKKAQELSDHNLIKGDPATSSTKSIGDFKVSVSTGLNDISNVTNSPSVACTIAHSDTVTPSPVVSVPSSQNLTIFKAVIYLDLGSSVLRVNIFMEDSGLSVQSCSIGTSVYRALLIILTRKVV